ncbi:Ctr copper transporter family-domain-containing protein [Mycena epipterygia]|nr:Ctr copper transporter family-domain-containing protein [Mycena epipterygia]
MMVLLYSYLHWTCGARMHIVYLDLESCGPGCRFESPWLIKGTMAFHVSPTQRQIAMDHHMPMPRCSMNLLWNTQIVDTCIVFRSWHVTSTFTFIVSCAVIMGLGVLYEALRAFQRNVDARITRDLAIAPGAISLDDAADAGTGPRKTSEGTPIPLVPRTLRAVLYGASVFLSFFLMLVFMTYNAYLILATVLGAALGHFIFNGTADVLRGDARGMACH